MLDGEIFLCGKAGPLADEDAGTKRAGNFNGSVGGAGVHDDDLVREGDAGEGTGEIAFFVTGDDGDRKKWHGVWVSGSLTGLSAGISEKIHDDPSFFG